MGPTHEHSHLGHGNIAPRRSQVIRETDLASFYRAISLAQHEGRFLHAHGPLEDTAWLHVTVRLLEELESSARNAVFGELGELERIRTMVSSTPTEGPRRARLPHHERGEQQSFVTVQDPAGVAVAASLLSRLDDDPAARWPERIAGVYAGGVAAIEQAFAAAEAYLRGRIDVDAFEAAVRASNSYGGMTDHGGAGEETRTPPRGS
jgi:hypothetical protein